MKIFVIGDIHGFNNKLNEALTRISLQKEDLIVFLGDYIDRGYFSKEVLDTLLKLKAKNYNAIFLRGNHEELLLKSYEDREEDYNWLNNGGLQTLDSFGVNSSREIPYKYIQFIKDTAFYFRYEHYIFSHAGLNLQIENPFLDTASLLWKRGTKESDLLKSKFKNSILINGHTPHSKNEITDMFLHSSIKILDNGVFLDRSDYGSLVVTELTKRDFYFI